MCSATILQVRSEDSTPRRRETALLRHAARLNFSKSSSADLLTAFYAGFFPAIRSTDLKGQRFLCRR